MKENEKHPTSISIDIKRTLPEILERFYGKKLEYQKKNILDWHYRKWNVKKWVYQSKMLVSVFWNLNNQVVIAVDEDMYYAEKP